MTYKDEDICKFINGLHSNSEGLFTYREAENYIYELEDNFGYDEFYHETGATKLVIIPTKEDYVIKVAFNGTYNDYEEEDEGHPFYGAESPRMDDYCDAEMCFYELAKERGFEKMFLPLEYFGERDCIHIYLQPKCERLEMDDRKQVDYSSKGSREKILKDRKDGKRYLRDKFPVSWTASCLDTLGSVERLQEFETFLTSTGIISDLHRGNIGYYDGHAVIMDYGGYNE